MPATAGAPIAAATSIAVIPIPVVARVPASNRTHARSRVSKIFAVSTAVVFVVLGVVTLVSANSIIAAWRPELRCVVHLPKRCSY